VAVAPRVVDPEQERLLIARQAALTALTSHPSWVELEAETDRRLAQIEKMILARALGGAQSAPPFDQRQVDYLRGFANGMRWIRAVPSSAEATLENFLKRNERKGEA
jgi:hypothetical protein